MDTSKTPRRYVAPHPKRQVHLSVKFQLQSALTLALLTATATVAFVPAQAAPKTTKPTTTKASPKVPAIFYDKEWSYGTATMYEKDRNFTVGVSGTAKFDRNGKFRQDYYIGSIGNFFKGTYKIQGDRLTTFDEKGKKIFDFKFTVGTKPEVLVLSMLDNGKKSIDFGLQPIKKKQ